MQHFRVLFLFFAIASLMVLNTVESRHGNRKKQKPHHEHRHHHLDISTEVEVSERVGKVRLPRILRRKYNEFSKAPNNFTVVYHSIPVKLEHITDDFFQLSAAYKEIKTVLLSVHLWIEFLDIEKSKEILPNMFLIDFIPIIGSQEMTRYNDSCSFQRIVSNPHFPDDVLEMKFNITSLYQACQVIDKSPTLKLKIRFYSLNNETDVNIARDEVYMFLLFKEEDDKSDIISFFPDLQHVKPLHYENVIGYKKPHTKSSKQRQKAAKSCSLRPFTFSFQSSGWEHVVYPLEYQSNKCQGKCAFPLASHLNYTNYAIVQAIGSTMYKEMKNPSCVAQDLAPLTMWVMDKDNKHTMKTQQNMIATSCKCC